MKLKLRLLAVVAAVSLLGLTVAGAFAGAADAAPAKAHGPNRGNITTEIPCTVAGVAETCTLKVNSFHFANDALTTAGTVTGGGVTVPFETPTQVIDPCTILDLILGPLHLNLLGLVVDLNQVHLTITGQTGPGNLLGNLLCGVAHLLDGGLLNTTALTQFLNHLNTILAGLGL
jgi:hypothetical protein